MLSVRHTKVNMGTLLELAVGVICYFREANKRSIDKSWRKWPYTGPEEEQFTWREIDSAKAMRIT